MVPLDKSLKINTMTTLKSKRPKPKRKTKTKTYKHTKDMESAATKEYVRQELEPLKRDVNRLWQVMLVGFGLILLVVLGGFQWLRSDMKELRADIKTDMREINKRLDMLIQNKQASNTPTSLR